MNKYFPSIPDNLDPRLKALLQQLWLRVNHLIEVQGKVVESKKGGKGIIPTPNVSIPAASDSLLGGQTYANPDGTQFSSNSVNISASGDGLSVQGSSGAAVINVDNAATFRSAIGVSLPTGVTAHTITLAKLTPAGANGSITWDANGWVTAYVDPT